MKALESLCEANSLEAGAEGIKALGVCPDEAF